MTATMSDTHTTPGNAFHDGWAVSVPGRGHPGSRPELPTQFCNLDRLQWMMQRRRLDGIAISLRPNVYYMSGYASRASLAQHEMSGYGAFFLSAADPDHPILLVPDFELTYAAAHP